MVSAVTFRAPSLLIKAPPLADPRPPTRVRLGRPRGLGAQHEDEQGWRRPCERGYWPEMNVALTLAGDMGWPLTAVVFGALIVAWVVFIARARPRS